MPFWKWEYTRKVSVDQYGTPVYKTIEGDLFEAKHDEAAKTIVTRLIKKIDPYVKSYPKKWVSAWSPCPYQFATARDMHFTAFTKRPFYGDPEISKNLDPWFREQIRIEKN